MNPAMLAQDIVAKMVAVLLKIPPGDRARFARAQLSAKAPRIVEAFNAITPQQAEKTVLFVCTPPHSRETRLAAAARLAGWNPILLHTDNPKYDPTTHFSFSARVDDMLQLVLATWLFPGPLIHVFVLRGDHAQLFARAKNRPIVLDLYDTCSGMKTVPPEAHAIEQETIGLVDGITHRDLRIRYLEKYHRYRLPRHNVFIHDPVPDIEPAGAPLRRNDGEIHVVSVGWVDAAEHSLLRVARAFSEAGVHLHVFLNPFQNRSDGGVGAYYSLQSQSRFFHIEQPVFGDAYLQQLRQYDFGIAVSERFLFGELSTDYTDDYLHGCGSSRLTDYIQLKLGVIVSPEYRFQYFWARRYAPVVVPATRSLLEQPLNLLLSARAARRDKDVRGITIQGSAARLGRFYAEVCAR